MAAMDGVSIQIASRSTSKYSSAIAVGSNKSTFVSPQILLCEKHYNISVLMWESGWCVGNHGICQCAQNIRNRRFLKILSHVECAKLSPNVEIRHKKKKELNS